MGIYLSDNDHDCLTNMRFADDVLLFERTTPKMLCEIKRSTEKVGLMIHPGKTKILSNQSSDTRKEIEIDDIEVQILTLREKHEIHGPDDYFPATGDDRNQKSNQGCLGDVTQVLTRADIEKLPAQKSTPAARRSGNPDDVLRIRNMDTHKRARENNSIDATQNAPTHFSNGKEDTKRS